MLIVWPAASVKLVGPFAGNSRWLTGVLTLLLLLGIVLSVKGFA